MPHARVNALCPFSIAVANLVDPLVGAATIGIHTGHARVHCTSVALKTRRQAKVHVVVAL
eukprot:15244925-Alexandrium_andersonii.AAC.1